MKYAAFISYKHAENSRNQAIALEKAIKAFAKPLFSFPEKIFRDEKHLIPSNDLPTAIKEGLIGSQTLIILADAEYAKSVWCQDELLFWLKDLHRINQLVIVLINDEIVIDEEKKIVWQETTALPHLLKDYITFVPFFVDLRWLKKDDEKTLLNANYKICITHIISKMRDTTPEELTDEDFKTARNNRRLRRVALTTISILFFIALFFGIFSNYQRKNAIKNYAQSLTSLAEANIKVDPTIAFSIAAKAFSLDKSNKNTYLTFLRTSELYHYSDRINLDRYLKSAEISPDLKTLLFIDRDGNASFYTLKSKVITKLNQAGIISKAIYSPDGSHFATASYDGTVFLWTTHTLRHKELTRHSGFVYALKFSNDGKSIVSVSNDGIVRVCRIDKNGFEEMKMENESIPSVSFSSDNSKLLTISKIPGIIRVWDIKNGTVQLKKSLNESLNDGCFSNDDSKVYACSDEGNVYAWNTKFNKINKVYNSKTPITAIRINCKNQFFVNCEGIIELFKMESSKPVEIESLPGFIKVACFSKDGEQIITGDTNGHIGIWDLNTNSYEELLGHTAEIASLQLLNNEIISSSYDRSIRVWNYDCAGSKKIKLNITASDFSPTKKLVAVSCLDSSVRIIDLNNNKTQIVKNVQGIFKIVKFSLDAEKLLFVNDSNTIIIQVKTSKIFSYKRTNDIIYNAEFSPDGNTILIAGVYNGVRIWDFNNKSYKQLKGDIGFISSSFYSPDGSKIAIFSDSIIRIWNVSLSTYKDCFFPTASIKNISFSNDSKKMLIVLSDSSSKLLNLENRTLINLKKQNTSISDGFFFDNGEKVITSDIDYINIQDIKSGKNTFIQSPFGAIAQIVSWPENDFLFYQAGTKLFVSNIDNNTTTTINDEYLSLDKLQISADRKLLLQFYPNGLKILYLDPDVILARSSEKSLTWKLDSLTNQKYGIEQ